MKQIRREYTKAEMRDDFERLKRDLQPGLVDGIRSAGFREAMLEEYRELAATTKDLIRFVTAGGFHDHLDARGQAAFAELMARVSVCGQRISIVIEQSNNMDQETVLALSAPVSRALN